MNFNKFTWERKDPPVLLSEEMILEMITPVFPDKTLDSFSFINVGLANTNIHLIFANTEDQYVLRIYTRDKAALPLEVYLSEKFGKEIPMPEFVHIERSARPHPYAIQKWIPGKPLYELLHSLKEPETKKLAVDTAKILAKIANHPFPQGGFFKYNLDIIPYETEDNLHPFVSYIQDCLFKYHAGRWLGEPLSKKVWQFILDHQSLFPAQEPACLVQGDFNPDNIIIDEKTFKIAGVLDWEFAFSGSYLFDIGTLFRFSVPAEFEHIFIDTYQAERNIKLPNDWAKMIKIQDLANLIGMINLDRECPNRINTIKTLLEKTIAL